MKPILIVLMLAASPITFAHLQVSPGSIHFMNTPVNSIGSQRSFTIRNTGQETLRVSTFHNCFSNFRVSAGFCSQLRPGQSCWVNISFRPYREGFHSCNFRISSDKNDIQSVHVSGNAVKKEFTQEFIGMFLKFLGL